MKKNHYQACKNSNRNLPFPEFSYMIKLHMLEHMKPTFQMEQIQNSEKEEKNNKNLRQAKEYFYIAGPILRWCNTVKWATIHIYV